MEINVFAEALKVVARHNAITLHAEVHQQTHAVDGKDYTHDNVTTHGLLSGEGFF
jgi:hypothetical protein